MSRASGFLAAGFLVLSFSVAGASSLPLYSMAGDLAFNLSPPERLFPNVFGTYSLADERYGLVTLDAAGVPFPSLLAGAIIGPNELPSIYGRGSGLLTYAVEVVGPSGTVPVLADVAGTASGFGNTGASFAVESRWSFLDGGTELAGDDIRSGQLSGSFEQSFGRTVDLMLTANHVYSVFMLADAAAAATLEGSHATARSYVDPVFSFGPDVDPLLYSFQFSDGIGNGGTAPVPEPGSLALLAAGLLSSVVALRASGGRRKGRQAPRG
jgi:hypothetical protein